MAALSPLDINANLRTRPPVRKEGAKPPAPAPAAKVSAREKDHPPPPPADVLEPPSFDRKNGAVYKTGGLLGKGGFAICYEGVLAGTRQIYALKVVKSRMMQRKMEQKFQTELQIHSKMKHPNIVQFHRAFTFQESTYIVLELCPNGSLMDMIKKRRAVTEPEVRFYTIQIAGAIKYMHEKGIIHRDLKMGNIFLDKDMNVKIGDFGLAALLMSGKDMTSCRRMTLCGTPNYIAPEILEKGKGGHDNAVDIWSLGIIIFAMLTGRPPFQSNTQEEIYRKAREREYVWPTLNKADNYIGEEAKELVAVLLQSPEDRPDCDTIVQHPFFSCGWVPEVTEMSPKLRESPPDVNQFGSGLRGGRASLYARNLQALCIKSNVGPWCKAQKAPISTYREVAAEEKGGFTPTIPIPDDVVYRPYDEIRRERKAMMAGEKFSTIASPKKYEDGSLNRQPVYASAPISTAPQSFAAQQRAINKPATISGTARRPRAHPQTVRSYGESAETDNDRLKANPVPRRIPTRSQEKNEVLRSKTSSTSSEERVTSDLAERLGQAKLDDKQPRAGAPPPSATNCSLFSPSEYAETLPRSKPKHILNNLERLHAELERALNSRSLGPVRKEPVGYPTLVVKWVDYSHRSGLGYMLNDGSVGSICRSIPVSEEPQSACMPVTYVVVRNGEKHLENRENRGYPDRNQIVPVSGDDIEFYENDGEEGISHVKVNPRAFTVREENGMAGKLSQGKDEWDNRKRAKISAWKRLANYMAVYGRDQDYPYNPFGNQALLDDDKDSFRGKKTNLVIFYQRFGDVGIWGFRDGSFQFNFPDHTKILISADGTWCDLYHLSLEAARDLAINGTLPTSALDERGHLSYPLQAFLNFMAKPTARNAATSRRRNIEVDPLIQGIPAANDFRRKIEFVRSIVGEWIVNGGIGRSAMEPEKRLRWLGHRDMANMKIPSKHAWFTIGAHGGDERRLALFDPRDAGKVFPDIPA